MNRRVFLRAVGVGTVPLLAGCTGSLDSTDPEQAAEHVDTAVDYLRDNADEFDELAKTFNAGGDPPSSYDASKVESRVAQANAEFDAAEEVATTDQLEYIAALRKVGDYQVEVGRFYADYVSAVNKFDTVIAYQDADRFDDALTALDEADQLLDQVYDRVDDVETALADIDREALAESDRIGFDRIQTDIPQLKERLDLFDLFIDGYRPFLEGMDDFLAGADAYQNEQYQTAVRDLSQAEDHFVEATGVFRRMERNDAGLTGLEASVVQLVCISDALLEGTRYFKESAQAAADGDMEQASQKAERAQDAFNQCGIDST